MCFPAPRVYPEMRSGVLSLHLGDALTHRIHIELFNLGDEIFEVWSAECTCLLEDSDTVPERNECRDGTDSEGVSELRLRVCIDLAEANICVLLGGLFENWAELAAWTAPGCPEVEKDDAILDGVLEVVGRDFDCCHDALSVRGLSRVEENHVSLSGGGTRTAACLFRVGNEGCVTRHMAQSGGRYFLGLGDARRACGRRRR